MQVLDGHLVSSVSGGDRWGSGEYVLPIEPWPQFINQLPMVSVSGSSQFDISRADALVGAMFGTVVGRLIPIVAEGVAIGLGGASAPIWIPVAAAVVGVLIAYKMASTLAWVSQP